MPSHASRVTVSRSSATARSEGPSAVLRQFDEVPGLSGKVDADAPLRV